MQITEFKYPCSKKNEIRVVLDQPRLFVEESLGSVMVRGEVIVDFLKDTSIQGPIELVFEGIQRYHTWPEIMRHRPLGNPIETKLQVTELSLLPPNSQGMMPAGIQRFPFEFPIPASLPATVLIEGRIEIFYHVRATLRRSYAENPTWGHWVEKASRVNKKKYTHQAPLRIVRPIQSYLSPEPTEDVFRTNIGLDEQYDQLASHLAGRTMISPLLDHTYGVRYQMSVDRTAIAMGTRVGIELMVEPTRADVTIKSVLLSLTEKRSYELEIPENHTWSVYPAETRTYQESVRMVLKWAYDMGQSSQGPSPSSIENGTAKCFLPNIPEFKNGMVFEGGHGLDPETMINLKEFNHPVQRGDSFAGCFMMPVPDCNHLLHPSMNHRAIKISHWLKLSMTIQCNKKIFAVHLESPVQLLDCRLVAADDIHQTILPPPPSYKPEPYCLSRPASTFWEQRQSITSTSGWGNCLPCPCELRKAQKEKKVEKSVKTLKRNSNPIDIPATSSCCSPSSNWGPPPCYSESL
ncbi:hypothetical protein BY458DRAFT_481034 [Sporodiniella umbellata]|nr:hypothetical protein BY458DRAFT_481034 [Sporodiniella umbellata]